VTGIYILTTIPMPLKNVITDVSENLDGWFEAWKKMTQSVFKTKDAIVNFLWEVTTKILPRERTDRLARWAINTVNRWAESVASYMPWVSLFTRYWIARYANLWQTATSLFRWDRAWVKTNLWRTVWTFTDPVKDLAMGFWDSVVKWKNMYDSSNSVWKRSTGY